LHWVAQYRPDAPGDECLDWRNEMTQSALTLIGDLVLENPAAMELFDELRVDFCCGGHRTLAEACAHANADLTEVLARLEGLPGSDCLPAGPIKWQDCTLVDLIAHIEAKHHAFTRSALGRLEPLMEKVLRVHGGNHPELAQIAQRVEALGGDLIPHLAKEEEILFPLIRQMESAPEAPRPGAIQAPIRAMLHEHEEVGTMLKELRDLTADYSAPSDACGSYRALLKGLHDLEADLHRHIYLENRLLFPRAIALEGAAGGS